MASRLYGSRFSLVFTSLISPRRSSNISSRFFMLIVDGTNTFLCGRAGLPAVSRGLSSDTFGPSGVEKARLRTKNSFEMTLSSRWALMRCFAIVISSIRACLSLPKSRWGLSVACPQGQNSQDNFVLAGRPRNAINFQNVNSWTGSFFISSTVTGIWQRSPWKASSAAGSALSFMHSLSTSKLLLSSVSKLTFLHISSSSCLGLEKRWCFLHLAVCLRPSNSLVASACLFER